MGDPACYKGRALTAGAMAFFHKPIEHDDLLSAIEETMTKQPALQAATPGGEYQIRTATGASFEID